MSSIQICGGVPLSGEIKIQGSKNTVLPVMAASLLHKGISVIRNVPLIQDVYVMMDALRSLGCMCSLDGHTLCVDASHVIAARIPDEYVRRMRSSIILMGAMLGRMREANMHYPGGCSIGKRPIDLHLMVFRTMGTEVQETAEGIEARAWEKLQGQTIWFPFPSVGATENAILTAVLAEGRTRLCGCAVEPEITELIRFLKAMGAQITLLPDRSICVDGVRELKDAAFEICGDRIVAGTYLTALLGTGGQLTLTGVNPAHMSCVLELAGKSGMKVETGQKQVLRLSMEQQILPFELRTEPYPGFPTDLQSTWLAVGCMAAGTSRIEETVFEGRYNTAIELRKMGADIIIKDRVAVIQGNGGLKGREVKAPDLRGGAALVIAGLCAEGTTNVLACEHIARGYEDICADLARAGADITVRD